MICANCKKTINLSFGSSGLNGCYCEECAEKLGLFSKIETRPKNAKAPKIPTIPQIIPIKKEVDIVALTEQLNGLIDRYSNVYGIYQKIQYMTNEETTKRLKKTLESIDNAINALCFRITEREFILKSE